MDLERDLDLDWDLDFERDLDLDPVCDTDLGRDLDLDLDLSLLQDPDADCTEETDWECDESLEERDLDLYLRSTFFVSNDWITLLSSVDAIGTSDAFTLSKIKLNYFQ